ncbi:MAG: arginase family protein [Thermoleophilia bacterium]|nr:arginase family protein [Thermoleophilia bacterium]
MWAISVVHTDDSLLWQRRLLQRCSTEISLLLPGSKCLCEEQTFLQAGEKLALLPPGLVFLGGSSFHHLSYHLVKRCASRPLGVVVFDKHNDFLPAPPGHISCGSWIRELTKLANVAQVLVVGAEPLGADLPEGLALSAAARGEKEVMPDKVRWVPLRSARRELAYFCASVARVYVSIDKDVLADANTDWGAGTLSLATMLGLLRQICRSATLVGADVCGEAVSLSPWPSATELAQMRKNEDINLAICQTLLDRGFARRLRRPKETVHTRKSFPASLPGAAGPSAPRALSRLDRAG